MDGGGSRFPDEPLQLVSTVAQGGIRTGVTLQAIGCRQTGMRFQGDGQFAMPQTYSRLWGPRG